jgi:hypothetical protein
MSVILLSLLVAILALNLLQQTHAYSFTTIKSQQLPASIIVKRNHVGIRTARAHHTDTHIRTSNRCINRSMGRMRSHLQMRDLSSANVFQIGDQVKVVTSVYKAGVDLNGRIGTVKETWEKCDVDPTCCCAEFVDENFAVTVKFDGAIRIHDDSDGESDGDGSDDSTGSATSAIIGLNDYFTHFFAEEELITVTKDDDQDNDESKNDNMNQPHEETSTSQSSSSSDAIPFDGMSCKAFKLDQLKMGKQAQRLAEYENRKKE